MEKSIEKLSARKEKNGDTAREISDRILFELDVLVENRVRHQIKNALSHLITRHIRRCHHLTVK